MKIVRIIARLNVGGPARHVVWLNEVLDGEEFESVLLTGSVPEGEEDMAYFADQWGVSPVYIKEMSREVSPKDLISLWKIFIQIRRHKPDIIHTHTAKAGTIGRIAGLMYRWLTPSTMIGRPRKVKIVHTFHGHVFHSYYGRIKTRLFLSIERILASFATDKIVVISQQQRDEIFEKFRIGRDSQFEIIPLGIDLEPYEDSESRHGELRDELGAADSDIIVGIIGRLTEVKNHKLFLNVASRLKGAETNGLSNLRFVIIGNGRQRAILENLAKSLNIQDVVSFLGNRNDPESLYAGLDIVALTSFNEGTPLSLIEAMTSDKPVISTLVGGVMDLLGEAVDEGNGFSIHQRGIGVRSNDVDGFCAGLELLRSDPGLRSRLAKSGREFVTGNYSKSRLVNDMKRLYRTLKST